MSAPGFLARIEPLEKLAADLAGWRNLAARAIEPNPFYEPEFLLAAARHLGHARRLRLLVIRDAAGTLAGLMPLHRPLAREGLLFGASSLYANAYTSLSAPLLAGGMEDAALEAALEAIPAATGHRYLLFPMLARRGAVAACLRRIAARRGYPMAPLAAQERPILRLPPADEPRPGRSLRRKARLLAARGDIRFELVTGDDPGFPAALEQFLQLEARGWKGRRGTALGCAVNTRDFAREAFAPRAGGVLIERLTLDEAPLALNLSLVSGEAAYTLKAAYDEDFEAFSPGALLDSRSHALMSMAGTIRRVDSCAPPGHPIGGLWRDRETIETLLVGLDPAMSTETLARKAAGLRRLRGAIDALRAARERFAVMKEKR